MGKNTCSHPGKKVSPSKEEHLRVIYQLLGKAPLVRSIDPAVHLGISGPSVNSVVTALREEGFVVKPLHGEICLIGREQKQGQIITTKFQLTKQLLIHHCDVNEQTASEDICKMEHLINDRTALVLKNASNECKKSFLSSKELKK